MPPNVRFFARFTSPLAFRYSVIFIVRLKKFQTTRPQLDLSSSLSWSFRDCGCGKAMSFDDLFRRDRPNKPLQRTGSGFHLWKLQVTLRAANLGESWSLYEKPGHGGIGFRIHRRENQGTWGLARKDAGESARNHTRGRP